MHVPVGWFPTWGPRGWQTRCMTEGLTPRGAALISCSAVQTEAWWVEGNGEVCSLLTATKMLTQVHTLHTTFLWPYSSHLEKRILKKHPFVSLLAPCDNWWGLKCLGSHEAGAGQPMLHPAEKFPPSTCLSTVGPGHCSLLLCRAVFEGEEGLKILGYVIPKCILPLDWRV